MTGRYEIRESVGNVMQSVHAYGDLEKHHPTWPEDLRKRHYGMMDGRREEFVRAPGGERMVSKDFVLSVDGNARVPIPSPLSGWIRRSERMDRWGTVEIHDGPGPDAALIGRVRHMHPIDVVDGQHVAVGDRLGIQTSKSPPDVQVGLHVHMDIAESRLGDFKRYFNDLDAGKIRAGASVVASRRVGSASRSVASGTGNEDAPVMPRPDSDEVRAIQRSLDRLGYRAPGGGRLVADGIFGEQTRDALRSFQHDHGLAADGIAGPRTLQALRHADAPLLSDGRHPQHGLFQQAREQLRAVEGQRCIGSGTHTDRLAGVIVVEAVRRGMTRVDRVELSEDGCLARGVQFSAMGDFRPLNRLTPPVPTQQAVRQPLSASSADVVQAASHPPAERALHEVPVATPRLPARTGHAAPQLVR